jgi:hypothetical protein
MVLAFAALLFQFAPAVQALPDVSLVPATPITKAASTSANPDQPVASVASGSNRNDPAAVSSASLTAASLDTTTQNSRSLSAIRVEEPLPDKPVRVIPAETPPRRTWLLLSIAQHSAATFDAYSTRAAVANGATEADPFMRPFALSPGIYAAIQVTPVILDFAARRMERSQISIVRRSWWIPQTVSTGVYLFSGVHNMRIANQHP